MYISSRLLFALLPLVQLCAVAAYGFPSPFGHARRSHHLKNRDINSIIARDFSGRGVRRAGVEERDILPDLGLDIGDGDDDDGDQGPGLTLAVGAASTTDDGQSTSTDTSLPTTETTPPTSTETPPPTTESPPVTTESPPITTESPPVTTESPPVTTESPPITTESPPITTESPPVTTESPPPTTVPTTEPTPSPTTSDTAPTTTCDGLIDCLTSGLPLPTLPTSSEAISSPPVTTEPPVTTPPPPTDPVTSPPVTTESPVTTAPVTTELPVTSNPVTTELPVTSGPPTTQAPVTTDSPTTELPVSTPPVTTELPVTTNPVTSPPVSTHPVTSEAPVTTDPVTSPPVTTDPVTSPPVTTNPVTSPPVTTDPVTSPPVTTDPVTSPPVTTEPPVTTNPVTSPPVTTELPVTTDPVTSPPVTTVPPTSEPPTTDLPPTTSEPTAVPTPSNTYISFPSTVVPSATTTELSTSLDNGSLTSTVSASVASDYDFLTRSSLVVAPTIVTTSSLSLDNPDQATSTSSVPSGVTALPSSTPLPSLPSGMPARILPAKQIAPDADLRGFTLVSFLFGPSLRWTWVASNSDSASQIMAYMPVLCQASLGISADQIKTLGLQVWQPVDYQSTADVDKLATIFLGYIPSNMTDQLQQEVLAKNSAFYKAAGSPFTDLAAQVDASFPITGVRLTDDGSDPAPGGGPAKVGASSSKTRENVIIGVVTSLGAITILVLALLLVRAIKQRRVMAPVRLTDSPDLIGARPDNQDFDRDSIGGQRRRSFYYAEDSLRQASTIHSPTGTYTGTHTGTHTGTAYTTNDPTSTNGAYTTASEAAMREHRPFNAGNISTPVLRENTGGW